MPRMWECHPFPRRPETNRRPYPPNRNASRGRIPNGPGHLGGECESTHIFDKKDCLTKWQSTYTGKQGLVASLPEYMDSLNKRLPAKASPAEAPTRLPNTVRNWDTRTVNFRQQKPDLEEHVI